MTVLHKALKATTERAIKAEDEIKHWRTVTGFDDPESLDFYLGRMNIIKHAEVQADIISKANERANNAEMDLSHAKDNIALLNTEIETLRQRLVWTLIAATGNVDTKFNEPIDYVEKCPIVLSVRKLRKETDVIRQQYKSKIDKIRELLNTAPHTCFTHKHLPCPGCTAEVIALQMEE